MSPLTHHPRYFPIHRCVSFSFHHVAIGHDYEINLLAALRIPSLSIAAEFHTLLRRGRRANIAIARFTQEKGAKSSFERVFEALEQILKARGLVVEDKKLMKQMRIGAGM